MKKTLILLSLLFTQQVLSAQSDTTRINDNLNEAEENLYHDPELALSYAHQALQASRSIFYIKGIETSLHKIGIVYDITGRYDSALFYFNNLYELGKRSSDSSMMATALNSRGLVLWNMGKPTESLPLFYSAYLTFESQNDTYGKAKAMNNISLVYMDLERSRAGIKACQLAIENFRLSGHPEKIGAPLTNIGLFYVMLGKVDSAELFLKESILLKEKYNDVYGLGITYNTLGNLYNNMDSIHLSSKAYQKAIDYKEMVGDRYGYISSSYNLAEGYNRSGREEEAKDILEGILPEAKSIGSNRILFRIYYGLFSYYANHGQYKKALDYQLAHIELRDSVDGSDLKREMENMRTQYETERKEKEILLLKKENEVRNLETQAAQKRDQIKSISLVSTGIFFLLFVVSAYLYYKRYKQKQEIRLATEIQQAEEKERGRIARDLHDNVGAHLAFIIQRLDSSGHSEKAILSESASNALGTLRETVWALNKNNISIEDFSDRLKAFIQSIQAGFPSFEIDFVEDIRQNHRLSPGTALNLFRLSQEAISNAFRHSKGKHIQVHVSCSETMAIEIMISDDGIGFDPVTDAKKDHYGLENMKHRAREAGAEYSLSSRANEGTRILISKNA